MFALKPSTVIVVMHIVVILQLQVVAAVVHGNLTKTTTLPNKASIFRAELHAISLALSLIRRSKEKNFIIFSDSMSSM